MGRWSVKWERAPHLSSKAVFWLSWDTSGTNAGPSFLSTPSCPLGFSQLLGASLCPTLTSALSLAQRGESPKTSSVTGVQVLPPTLPFLLLLKGGAGRNRTRGPSTEVPALPSLRGSQCDVCAPKRVCSDPNLGAVQPRGVRARGMSRRTISLTAAGDKLGEESRKCTWFLKPRKQPTDNSAAALVPPWKKTFKYLMEVPSGRKLSCPHGK